MEQRILRAPFSKLQEGSFGFPNWGHLQGCEEVTRYLELVSHPERKPTVESISVYLVAFGGDPIGDSSGVGLKGSQKDNHHRDFFWAPKEGTPDRYHAVHAVHT